VLHVDVEPGPAGQARVRVTLYVPEAIRPVAPLHEVELSPQTWAELRHRVHDFEGSRRIARTMWRDLLSAEIRELLEHHADRPLVVLGDDRASGLPWEMVMDDRDDAPPRIRSVARQIALRGSYRTPAEQVERSRLRVLIVADPLGDLPNAVPEARAVARSLGGRADVVVECLFHEQATVEAVASRLERGHYDVLHYAGHARFDDVEPDRGGLALADGFLSAATLPPISPQLVFLSACESGRLRDIDAASAPAPVPGPALALASGRGRSLAEAFLRAGVRAFIGTFYAVDDASAREFASIVHGQIASGCALGDAVHAARRALYDSQRPDWGNFLLYGDHAMIL
jgi:CHAT domain-containing protein